MAHGISVPSGGRAASRGSKRLLALRGDDHLVERLRRGDDAAFEVIYERHVAGLLSFCRHMLSSREEAEDAVQHAFTAAHRDLLRDEREIRLKAWLYAIARNRCVSMLRARREQPDERVEASTDGLDAEVQRRAELRQLMEDLQDLPEDQRAALVLSELRDLSHAEVAVVLGCRVANVKGLVFRARAGLSERREARDTACEAIREELAVAHGGMLRRGKLRHHLRACAPCSAYLEDVRHQRKMMAAILPVVPTAGLKSGVLAAVGIGGGSAGAGGVAAGGGLLTALTSAGGATVAKVAIIGAVLAGGGVAGEAALDGGSSRPDSAPAVAPGPPAAVPAPLGGIDSAGAAEQKRSDAARRVASKRKRAKLQQKRQRLKERKAQRLGRGRALAPGRSRRPPATDRGRPAGAGQPVRRTLGDSPKSGNAPPPRTRARPRPPAPEPKGRSLREALPGVDGPTPKLVPVVPDE